MAYTYHPDVTCPHCGRETNFKLKIKDDSGVVAVRCGHYGCYRDFNVRFRINLDVAAIPEDMQSMREDERAAMMQSIDEQRARMASRVIGALRCGPGFFRTFGPDGELTISIGQPPETADAIAGTLRLTSWDLKPVSYNQFVLKQPPDVRPQSQSRTMMDTSPGALAGPFWTGASRPDGWPEDD